MQLLFFILVISSLQLLNAQNLPYVFRDKNDQTKNLYLPIVPPGEIKGLLILLPGFGETPEEVLMETKIPEIAAKRGILTVIPFLTGWDTFFVDSLSQNILDDQILEVYKKYNIKNNNIIIGGFSLGGAGAIKYAERSFKSNAMIKPKAVFGIDPPVDLEKFYFGNLKIARLAKTPNEKQSAEYFINRIRKEFIEDPLLNPKAYWHISPFSCSDSSLFTIKSLTTIPVKIYCEPDIAYYLANGKDYTCMSVVECSAMINELKILGNKNAELIITADKGYRSTGARVPHSWSIADPQELTLWMEKIFK